MKRVELCNTPSAELERLDDIDMGDDVVHDRIPGTLIAYCGVDLHQASWLPPLEVTEAAWCPECEMLRRLP